MTSPKKTEIYGRAEDGGIQLAATSSSSYCKDAVIFNTKQCWGFVTNTVSFASTRPFEGGPE